MCMAIAYAHMLRFLGGVPILDHAVQTDEEMKYPRNTFAETVDFIVKLCNEAAPDLPWTVSAVESGRLTRAAALGLKLRILCFAASPTFNSDTKWHPQADEFGSPLKCRVLGELMSGRRTIIRSTYVVF